MSCRVCSWLCDEDGGDRRSWSSNVGSGEAILVERRKSSQVRKFSHLDKFGLSISLEALNCTEATLTSRVGGIFARGSWYRRNDLDKD